VSVTVREARADDENRWRALWDDYTRFYQVTVARDVTDDVWSRIFDPSSTLFLRVAEVDGEVQGFALCLTHEATWVREPTCYLEDLFLDANLRGKGVGRAMMDDLVRLCREKGWSRLYWHTQESNSTARKLYDHYIKPDDHIRYRVSL
jgi:GNAT superfamily N-acetyltransferase